MKPLSLRGEGGAPSRSEWEGEGLPAPAAPSPSLASGELSLSPAGRGVYGRESSSFTSLLGACAR
jgi:hypothetical protein